MSLWSRKYKTSTCLWSPDSFPCSSLLMTLPFALLEGDNSFSITHPLSSFRFCGINHVSAPNLLSDQCNMSNENKKGPYNDLCHHLWDSLAPSEFLALWQCQQLNMSVCHASSVVNMLGAQVGPATAESHAPYLSVFMVLHILQTPSPTRQWILTGATHKN